jgi:hypothetical protein
VVSRAGPFGSGCRSWKSSCRFAFVTFLAFDGPLAMEQKAVFPV